MSTEQPYTPSLDAVEIAEKIRDAVYDPWNNTPEQIAEFIVEEILPAVRAEEREKVAQVVERYWPKFTGVNLPDIIRAQRKEQGVKPETRDAGTCECGEPVEKVKGFDGIWRWAHERRGIVRDHVARPVG